MSSSRFRLVPGGEPAKPRRKAATPWECRVCEPVLGVRTRSLVKVRQGAFEDARGRITGGRDIWVCATCLARGVLTPVTS
jgi:hypothetical protein